MLVEITCSVCGRSMKPRYEAHIKSGQSFYCSNECKSLGYKARFSGTNNPNAGKKWSKEQRIRGSQTSKERFKDPKMRYAAGSANRDKKFDQERIDKMYQNRDPNWANWRPDNWELPEESKKRIGKASSDRWKDPSFIAKQRKTRETNGDWIALEEKDAYDLYRKEANWKHRMWDIVEDPRNLLETVGVFSARGKTKNTKGCVRDHRYSRRSGFENQIPPVLLRHPCNCELLLHSENTQKRKSQYRDADSISLDELLLAIQNYEGDWFEQKECLEVIRSYSGRSGPRRSPLVP